MQVDIILTQYLICPLTCTITSTICRHSTRHNDSLQFIRNGHPVANCVGNYISTSSTWLLGTSLLVCKLLMHRQKAHLSSQPISILATGGYAPILTIGSIFCRTTVGLYSAAHYTEIQ